LRAFSCCALRACQLPADEVLEALLPRECGDMGTRLVSLLSVLRVLESLHRALKFVYVHCNHVEVSDGAGAGRLLATCRGSLADPWACTLGVSMRWCRRLSCSWAGVGLCVIPCIFDGCVCVPAGAPVVPSANPVWFHCTRGQESTELRLLEFGARELETHAEKLFAMTSLTIPNAARDFAALKRCVWLRARWSFVVGGG
jgi:hypothetical protein